MIIMAQSRLLTIIVTGRRSRVSRAEVRLLAAKRALTARGMRENFPEASEEGMNAAFCKSVQSSVALH